jgi:hypothetical protein
VRIHGSRSHPVDVYVAFDVPIDIGRRAGHTLLRTLAIAGAQEPSENGQRAGREAATSDRSGGATDRYEERIRVVRISKFACRRARCNQDYAAPTAAQQFPIAPCRAARRNHWPSLAPLSQMRCESWRSSNSGYSMSVAPRPSTKFGTTGLIPLSSAGNLRQYRTRSVAVRLVTLLAGSVQAHEAVVGGWQIFRL